MSSHLLPIGAKSAIEMIADMEFAKYGLELALTGETTGPVSGSPLVRRDFSIRLRRLGDRFASLADSIDPLADSPSISITEPGAAEDTTSTTAPGA